MTRTDWSGWSPEDTEPTPDVGLLAAQFDDIIRNAPYPIYRCVGCGTGLREIENQLRHMVGFKERYGCTNPVAETYEPKAKEQESDDGD